MFAALWWFAFCFCVITFHSKNHFDWHYLVRHKNKRAHKKAWHFYCSKWRQKNLSATKETDLNKMASLRHSFRAAVLNWMFRSLVIFHVTLCEIRARFSEIVFWQLHRILISILSISAGFHAFIWFVFCAILAMSQEHFYHTDAHYSLRFYHTFFSEKHVLLPLLESSKSILNPTNKYNTMQNVEIRRFYFFMRDLR